MASLGQLTAGIAHEINNPINFVTSSILPLRRDLNDVVEVLNQYATIDLLGDTAAQLLSARKFGSQLEIEEVIKEIQALLKSIEDGAGRTSEIVKSLRNFARTDEHALKDCNLHEGLDSTLIILKSQYNNRITIHKNYGDIPIIQCFPGQINQVFMNILTNGIQAIPGKGEISISTGLKTLNNKREYIEVVIKDSGPGMTEETSSKIFDPFFTTKEVGEGTGLGLSISYGIIQKHKGTIAVKSAPGEGATFIILLPTDLQKGEILPEMKKA